MHIHDSVNDRTIDDIFLYFTPEEAKELYDGLARVISVEPCPPIEVSNG